MVKRQQKPLEEERKTTVSELCVCVDRVSARCEARVGLSLALLLLFVSRKERLAGTLCYCGHTFRKTRLASSTLWSDDLVVVDLLISMIIIIIADDHYVALLLYFNSQNNVI